jgi:hypothetical protein
LNERANVGTNLPPSALQHFRQQSDVLLTRSGLKKACGAVKQKKGKARKKEKKEERGIGGLDVQVLI